MFPGGGEGMAQTFLVYYWMGQGEKGHSICEMVTAESVDDATQIVHSRLKQPFFVIDSQSRGRCIIQTANIQYIEIEMDAHCRVEDGYGLDCVTFCSVCYVHAFYRLPVLRRYRFGRTAWS
jgi:hypothetical protein